MTALTGFKILVDFLAVALLIFGFVYEEKVIDFEMAVKRIVLGNIRRARRIRNQKKAVKNGQHLRVVKTVKTVSAEKTYVA